MKRVINFRTFLFSAFFIMLGILSVYFQKTESVLGLIIFALAFILIGALFYIYKNDKTKILGMIMVFALFLLSIVSFEVAFVSHKSDYENPSQSIISGKVEEVIDNGVSKSVILSRLNFLDKEVEGRAIIYISEKDGEVDLSACKSGDLVVYRGELEFTELIENGKVNSYLYKYGVRYVGFAGAGDMDIFEGSQTLVQSIRTSIKNALLSGLGEKYGSIAYGMLVGDKSTLDFYTRDYFSASGIGHVLSVSGLHVMFISTLIFWLLKKLRVKRGVSLVVVLTVLLAYNILVGFTASVVRATIMCVCLNVASIIGARNDTLNNLGLSTTIILLISPLSLFDAGFLMSVCAVLGIVLFYKLILKQVEKIKYIPKYIAKSIAVSASAQIGILPVLIYFFKSVSLYSILVNVVLMPIIMIAFILIIVLVFPVILFPKLSFILAPAKAVLWVIDFIAELVASIPYAQVIVYSGIAILLAYLLYFIVSRFVMAGKIKWWVSVALTVILSVTLLIENVPLYRNENAIYFTSDYAQVTSVMQLDGRVVVVGDLYKAGNTTEILEKLKARKIDAVYLTSVDLDTEKSVLSLSVNFEIDKIYIPKIYEDRKQSFIDRGLDVAVLDTNQTTEDGLVLVSDGDNVLGYEYACGEVGVLFASASVKMNADDLSLVSKYRVIRAISCNYERFTQLFINNYSNAFLYEQPANYVSIEKDMLRFNLDTQKIEKF